MITLIGKKLAKPGQEFIHFGVGNSRECMGCKLRKVCDNLEVGRRYVVKSSMNKPHEKCKIHEEGVMLVEVEAAEIPTAVTANLAKALGQTPQPATTEGNGWDAQAADSYALRAAEVMFRLALTRNPVIDLSAAQGALESAVRDERSQIQILAAQTLAHFDSPGAQRAIATMALDTNNPPEVQISGFESLATSAKLNANMLPDEVIDAIYALTSSETTDPALRSAAAAAYGALNLPSQKVKDLILDQARS